MSKLNLNTILKGGVEEFDENGNPVVRPTDGEGAVVDPAEFEPMTEEEQIAQEEADALNEEFPADEAQLDSDSNDLDALTEQADGLESIANKLEIAIADGGLSPAAAEFALAAVESYYKPLGETQTASVESFGGFTTRLTASQEVLDNVKATLKKIWEGIKALVTRVWNWLKEFFRKIFTAVGRLETVVKRLEKRLEAHDGNFAEKIEGGKIARIAIGTTASADNMTAMVNVAKDCLLFDDEGTEWVNHINAEIQRFATTPIAGDEAKLAAEVQKKDKERHMPRSFKSAPNDKSGLKTWSTDVLPGNVRFHLRKKKAAKDALEELIESAFGPYRFEKETVSGASKATPASIKAFNAGDIQTVIKGAHEVIAMAKRFDGHAKKTSDKVKEFEIAPGISNEQAAAVRQMLRQYAKQLGQSRQMSAKVLAYCVSATHGFIAVAHRSLKGKSKE